MINDIIIIIRYSLEGGGNEQAKKAILRFTIPPTHKSESKADALL